MILLQKTPGEGESTEIGFVIQDGVTWWEMYDEFRRFLLAVGYDFSQEDVANYHAQDAKSEEDDEVEDVEADDE